MPNPVTKLTLQLDHSVGGGQNTDEEVMMNDTKKQNAGREGELSHDEEEQDEELEEGREHCPICEKVNWPGACDTCEHFVGDIWDGDLRTDNVYLESLVVALRDFIDARETIETDTDENFEAFAHRLTEELNIDPRLVLFGDGKNYSLSDSIREIVGFSLGEFMSTDGMIGGSGHTLYLEDAKRLASLSSDYERLTAQCRQRLAELIQGGS